MPRRRKLLTARRKRKVAKLAARQRRAAERSFIRAVENFGVIQPNPDGWTRLREEAIRACGECAADRDQEENLARVREIERLIAVRAGHPTTGG
jgi:uncharacterized protein with von Willebrand factor type A (vWA) domain